MQIRSGQAQVLGADHNRVTFNAITPADAAQLAAGQQFQFSGESSQFYVIASVVSLSPTVTIDLTADYAGGVAFDTLTDYLIWTDFTPTRGFVLLAPGDVDIRGAETYNWNLADTLIGSGGGAFTKSGIASVSAGAVTKTVTPPSGSFPSGGNYIVLATPEWMTAWMVRPSSKTTGQFILDFSVEAPAGGGNVSWGVV